MYLFPVCLFVVCGVCRVWYCVSGLLILLCFKPVISQI